METILHTIEAVIENLDLVCELFAAIFGYVGIAIILYGGLKGFMHFLHATMSRKGHIPHIRIELAAHLSLGLEFLVGKDIVETIVDPSWDDLGKLIVVVLLRTGVSLFLEYELLQTKKGVHHLPTRIPLTQKDG
ncbi:hypothetical protein COU80_03870 [Candidatus Peregrinibacteria bacterium CG10_big_fil_rev_8_21_14_0_10_55_24]|nr:MAG: hypothetical protein COU80_03870 [Candidatus Peregrinibacteria bacterium CG10_big_fil_rev_8_21_14_0_10_55_24]